MDSQGFADGFARIRESSQWIRTDSRKFTMDSHRFAKGRKYTPIRTDSRKFTKVRNRFTSIRGWIRKDSQKFTFGFAPIHKDSHPIIQSNHGGIRELRQLHQYFDTVRLRARTITGTQRMDDRAAIGSEPCVSEESVSIPRHAPPRAGPGHFAPFGSLHFGL